MHVISHDHISIHFQTLELNTMIEAIDEYFKIGLSRKNVYPFDDGKGQEMNSALIFDLISC